MVKSRIGKEMTAVEAARRLGVGLEYLYSLVWTGKLEARKVGNRWLISDDAVVARLKKRRNHQCQNQFLNS